MKIGPPAPVPDFPPTHKYAEVWEKAHALPEGTSLPIECQDREEAATVASGLRDAFTDSQPPFNVKQRGPMVWVWRQQPPALPKPTPKEPRARKEPE